MSLSKRLKRIRRELWDTSPICFVCLFKIEDYVECSLEHILPKSLGGSDKKRNLAISHVACNNLRKNIHCRLLWMNQQLIPQIARPRKIIETTPKKLMKAWREKYLRSEEIES